MSLPLFTKSYVNDLGWLKLAIQSVCKMAMEPVTWHIAIEDAHLADLNAALSQVPALQGSCVTIHPVGLNSLWPEAYEIGNGYLRQQWIKMNAHKAVGTGLFWNWDSDLIAVKKISQASFMGQGGRPVYWFTNLNSIIDPANQSVYVGRANVLKGLFGMSEISFEWMRCLPIPGYGEILRLAAERPQWATCFGLCKTGEPHFSEFNIIGQFSHLYFPDSYEWRNTQNYQTWGDQLVKQFWSYSGVTQQAQDIVDAL